MSQVLAHDQVNDPDIAAMIGTFAAVHLSSVPFNGPLGACRVGMEKNGNLVVFPTHQQINEPANVLNLTMAANKKAIVMVEAGAIEVSETAMLEALEKGQAVCVEIAEMCDELRKKAGKPKTEFEPPVRNEKLDKDAEKKFAKKLDDAVSTDGGKHVRKQALKAVKADFETAFPAPKGADADQVKAHGKYLGALFDELSKAAERRSILGGKRADGRKHEVVRDITSEVSVLPRVHGSAVFTRGETQALVTLTLGSVDDQQIIDGLFPEHRKKFLLHYTFPPFSVGEVKPLRGPGRREIGHGALAERALESMLPDAANFPYTIRLTSEILESNGSSSMATVCAGTMALMDAGIPIKQPVAGIAMGLVKDGRKLAILSDILGSEDHCGDMDFKVAGTQHGITALQMDIKCDGLTRTIMTKALEQARVGRIHILKEMLIALRRPRTQLSPYAPRLESLKINSEKIGTLIGPGGKNIRGMQDMYECKISVEDDGTVIVSGNDADKVDAAVKRIRDMTAEVEVGTVYLGRVVSVKEFGAFVEILPGQEGLCHVSELSNEFVRSVTDVVRIGDEISVRVIAVDEFGKIKLSRKAALGDGGGGGPGRRPADGGPQQSDQGGDEPDEFAVAPVGGTGLDEDEEDRDAGPPHRGGDRGPRGPGRGRPGGGGRGGPRGAGPRGDGRSGDGSRGPRRSRDAGR
jgi:polyribonucleotide nucleotidyltransferase